MYGKLPNKMGSLNKNESVSKWSYSLFLHKARLSQARALLFPKVLNHKSTPFSLFCYIVHF